ncbi:hypothetical protein DY052_05950 [Apilactobacillus timberlakei]|uniref:hypothetical protein n=1 Tax=Apilactobacillus timberlakei TaxID=2008380 RepID=UPI00112D0AAB|nr:hypothetical protein [Apilactobacillus timberlakei]TPR14966.1 hypothetical protein DY052_05950 [Apilactobacillus timberlakei]
MGLNNFANNQNKAKTTDNDRSVNLDKVNDAFGGEHHKSSSKSPLARLAEEHRHNNFRNASHPENKNGLADKNNVPQKSFNDEDVNFEELSLFSYKILKTGTEMVDNFTDNEPVINPLINYVQDDMDANILRKKLNFEIFSTSRHSSNGYLNGGSRLSTYMPKYIVNALNTVLNSINNGENNGTVKQLIEDLEVENTDGELIIPGKNMSVHDFKVYNNSIKINLTWLIDALLMGTIKIDDILRENIIKNISNIHKNKEKYVQYMLNNNIITPNNVKDFTSQIKLMLSDNLIKWYNISLYDTTQRIFNQQYSRKNIIKSFDDNNINHKLNDGITSNMLAKLGSGSTMINNRLHYVLFVE